LYNNQTQKAMATKTWKLGEVCKGGVITVNTTKTKVTVIGKHWDLSAGTRKSSNQSNAKEWIRKEVSLLDGDARRKIDFFIHDLTTSYHTGKILEWIESKVEFKTTMW
jgi:hypothetical protein